MAAVHHLGFDLRVFWTTHKEYLVVLVTVQNSVGIDASFMFCEFGLKMPIYAPFGVVFGGGFDPLGGTQY